MNVSPHVAACWFIAAVCIAWVSALGFGTYAVWCWDSISVIHSMERGQLIEPAPTDSSLNAKAQLPQLVAITPDSLSKWVPMEATAYAHTCTMRDDGEPDLPRPGANGKWPVPNFTLAADKSIPMGTKVQVSHGNRIYDMIVGDRGSAITGNRIDIFLESCEQAVRWGRRTVWARWAL